MPECLVSCNQRDEGNEVGYEDYVGSEMIKSV